MAYWSLEFVDDFDAAAAAFVAVGSSKAAALNRQWGERLEMLSVNEIEGELAAAAAVVGVVVGVVAAAVAAVAVPAVAVAAVDWA